MTRKLILICILAFFISPTISSAQTITKVFDNPKDYAYSKGKFLMHVDVRSMKRVKLYLNEDVFDPKRIKRLSMDGFARPEKPEPSLDGFLMVVADGTKPAQQSQTWGSNQGLLDPPKINVFIPLKLGTTVREQVTGTKRVWVAFELRVLTGRQQGEKTTHYVAQITEIRPAP